MRAWARRVGSVVPTGFEAYARIFHPIWVNQERKSIRWSDLAERYGRTLQPETSFWELVRPPDAGPNWSTEEVQDRSDPTDGSLPKDLCGKLAGVLAPFTSAVERTWFAVWDGWGDIPPELASLPKARAPYGRSYILFAGPLASVTSLRWGAWFQSPSLWWPDDRAWCVATEIDDYSTFVAGSEACIEAIEQEPVLETLRTRVDARADFGPYPPRDANER